MDTTRTESKKARGILPRFSGLDVKKKIQYLAIGLIIVVILAIYFASAGKTPAPPTRDADEAAADVQTPGIQDGIEEKLKAILSRIEGAGEVEVMVTYESSAEIVPAVSMDTQTSTTTDSRESGTSTTNSENVQRQVVTLGGSGGNAALVIKENSPTVRGVIVVAQGADDIAVKLSLLKAVQTILNVSPDKVDVYRMRK